MKREQDVSTDARPLATMPANACTADHTTAAPIANSAR